MTVVEQLAAFGRSDDLRSNVTLVLGSIGFQAGQILPNITLPTLGGLRVGLEGYRGRRNLVLIFAGDELTGSVAELLEEINAAATAIAGEEAEVLVIVTSEAAAAQGEARWKIPVLIDRDARIHRLAFAMNVMGHPAVTVIITDRYREVFGTYHAGHGIAPPHAADLLSWLVFINVLCRECGAPERPVEPTVMARDTSAEHQVSRQV